MKKKNYNPEDSARLRQRAEELILSQKSEISNSVSETDILKLIHELEVHQFELEMQNEELAIAKEKAELAEEKYTELYNYAPSGYFTVSRNGSIQEINLCGAQMLGKERSLLINCQFGFFVKEDSRIVFANFLAEIFQGKSHVNCDLPLISPGDISLHVHLTGILSGTKEECRITAVDITERKVAEDELRKNLAKYKVLIDTFPIAITISDPEGKIIETNEKALELLGLSREEHLRRKLKGEEWTIIKPDGTVFPQDEYASVKALKENRLVENVEMGIVKSEQETTWLNVTAAPIPIEDFGVVIAYSDITPRKKVEQELTKAKDLFEKSEIQARDILQTAMDGFWMVNSEGCIINVNQVACEMLGYSHEEMLSMRIADVDSEETSVHTQNRMQKIVETGEDRFETKHRCKDGKIIDVEVSVKSQPFENFVVFVSNITERKQAEKALKNRENLLNKVFDLLPVGLWFADASGRLIRGNPAGAKIWGAEPTVPIEEYGIFKARLHPSGTEIGPDDWALAHTIREGVTVANEQLEIDTFDGQKKIILNYTAPVLDEQGKIQGAIVVNEDITQRISAEQALLKSEEKYRQLIENSHDIIYTFSTEGVFMYVSPAWESLLGYPETEALGKSFHKLVHPDDLPACMEFFQKVITTNQRVEGIEYRIQHANGTWVWHTSSAVPLRDETGNILGYEGIARDITKRKQAEEALLKSEFEFRLLAEAMPQIVWITRPDGWNTFFNQQWVTYTGLTLEESYGHGWNKPFHPDDQQPAWDAWQNATKNMATYSLECRLRRFDGEYKWWLVRGVPVLDADGAVIKWFGTCTDIDEIKCSEAELINIKEKVEERETYLRSVLQSNNDIIVSRDLNNNVVFFNKAFDDITMELFNQRAFAGMNTLDLLPAEEGEHWKNVLEKVKNGVANEEEYWYTTLLKTADYLTSHFPVIQGSKVVGTLEVTKDITLFKNRENELKIAKDNAEESEEKYRALFYNAPLSYQSLDENGCFIDVNPMWLKTLGYDRSEVIGKWYGDFLHPDFVEHFRINFPAFKKRGYVSGVQFKLRRKDSTCIDVSFEGCVGYTPEGEFKQTYCVFKDITEQKALENELAESAERFKSLHNASFGGIAIHDKGIILECNQGLSEMTGYSSKELIGMDGLLLIAPQHREMVMNEIISGNEKPYEANGLRKNGEQFPMRLEARGIPYKGKNVRTVEFRDITETKQAEAALRMSEAKLSALFTSMSEMVVLHELVFDGDGTPVNYRITDCNEAFTKITGIPRNNAIGKLGNEVYGTAEPPYLSEFAEVAITGETYHYETYFEPLDKHLYISVVCPDKNHFATVTTDITERKLAELLIQDKSEEIAVQNEELNQANLELIAARQKAEESEARFRNLMESIDAVAVQGYGPDGITQFWNKASEKLYGYTNQEAIGSNLLDLIIPDEMRETVSSAIHQMAATGEPVSGGELLLKHKNGSLVPVISHHSIVKVPGHAQELFCLDVDITQLKILENELKASEERFNLAMKATNDGLFDWNLTTNEIYYSPAWKNMLGYEDHELPNDFSVWEKTTDPQDVKKSWELQQKLITRQTDRFVAEFKMKHKDGHWVDILSRAEAFFNNKGEAVRMVGTHTDITERKRSEMLIKEYSGRLELTMESANMAWWELDLETGNVIFNKKKTDMLGYSQEQFHHYTDFTKLVHPDDYEPMMSSMKTLLDEKVEKYNSEYRIKAQSGEYIWFHDIGIISRRTNNGEPSTISGIVLNITERKHAEEEIKKTGQHYQALIEKAPDGIVLIDAEGKFKYISPSAKRMFGYNQSDEITGHPNEYTHPDDLPFVLSELEKVFKDPTYITTIEYRFIDKSGNWHWIETTFSNLLANPSVESIILNFRDITERKLSEQAISLSEEKFRKAFITSPDSININRLEDGMYISINKGFTEITGYTEEEVQSKTSIEINIWATDDERKKVNDEIKSKGYVENLEVKFRKKDGILVDGLMSASIIELEGVPHILSITRDITERKQAETKLHQSEERYALVIEASEQGIWDWNVETDEVFYSEQWKKQIGYDDNELKNEFDTWIEHLHPDEKEYCLNAVNSYLNHPIEHFMLDFRFRHKDGTYRWIHNKAASIKNDEGKVIRLFGTHTDFTESKLSEAIFIDIIEKNPMSIQILDMEGYPIQVNPAHTKLFGVEPPADYSVFKDTQLLSLGFDKLFDQIKKGEVVFFPDSYYNVHDVNPSFPDSPAWVKALGFTLNDNNGNPSKIVLMHENITERKNAEALLNDIIENNPMSIQIVDKEGHTLRGNPAFVQLFGSVPPPEFSIFEDLKSKSTELENLVSRVKNGDIVHLPDIYFNAHDVHAEAPDIPLWIRALIFPLNDSAGKPGRFVFMHENITERKLYEAEIHTLNEELEQRVIDRTAQLEAANKELEAFSYSVSHDLRTPLRALNGFATILTEDYSIVLDDEGKRLLAVISENATKMGFLIDDLLSFSRLGRIEMLPSLINMKTMAETVYNELVPETEKDKISFMIANLPAASGDPSMVKQVWVNLIGNAIKFTSKKTDRHIEVGVMGGENENIYYVKDNGAGFEMAHATKLFGVFQRLHTLKEFDGIGAGLAIVRRIILRHNGRVWAEGKVNEGATFYFSLPLQK